MKKAIMALALTLGMVSTAAAVAPTEARAGDNFRVGVNVSTRTFDYRHCNACRPVVSYQRVYVQPVYQARRVFVGYDHCGNPVYRTQNVCVRRGYYKNVAVTRYSCSGSSARNNRRYDDHRGQRSNRSNRGNRFGVHFRW